MFGTNHVTLTTTDNFGSIPANESTIGRLKAGFQLKSARSTPSTDGNEKNNSSTLLIDTYPRNPPFKDPEIRG